MWNQTTLSARLEFYCVAFSILWLLYGQRRSLVCRYYSIRGRGIGVGAGLPYEMTRPCYRDEELAWGRCDACAFRLEAFWNGRSRDPIENAERPDFS